jgi:hypothetical protein
VAAGGSAVNLHDRQSRLNWSADLLLLRGAIMNIRMLLIFIVCVLSVGAIATPSDATTSFGASRIIAIDQDQRTITFRTKEGDTWTLPVNDPNLLNQQAIAKDDQVTIEIDLNDRITKVVKPSERSTAPRTESEDR